MTVILDGKKLRDKILEQLEFDIKNSGKTPSLVVILVGDNPASKIYVNNKRKTAEKVGIKSEIINLPTETTEKELLDLIEKLNNDETVDAVLVQLPLPEHINEQDIISAINPKKDVDGFTAINAGRLATGMEPYVYPCTPKGILLLLDAYGIELEGKHAVVVGRSNIVGKPLSQMLLRRNATVTTCHSHTKNLSDIIKTADIIISAVGKKIIKREMINKNPVIVDVGIYRDESGKISGDVDFEPVSKLASYISPVPGGVGPMTIASLMLNTFELSKLTK